MNVCVEKAAPLSSVKLLAPAGSMSRARRLSVCLGRACILDGFGLPAAPQLRRGRRGLLTNPASIL